MKLERWIVTICLTLIASTLSSCAASPEAERSQPSAPPKIYGEWLIRVKPDKGAQYDQLIEEKGLPLFHAAGGRMVGWWKTLVGNLYEHVTIWEYDDMAGFEKAIQFLGPNEKFAEFVKLRDPLLDGEDSRFMTLSSSGSSPALPERANFVIHETHRVPLIRIPQYMSFMRSVGLDLLEKHGFDVAGPFVTTIGTWSEVTHVIGFRSLTERDRLLRDFYAHEDGAIYVGRVRELAPDITTRLLYPAPFAK